MAKNTSDSGLDFQFLYDAHPLAKFIVGRGKRGYELIAANAAARTLFPSDQLKFPVCLKRILKRIQYAELDTYLNKVEKERKSLLVSSSVFTVSKDVLLSTFEIHPLIDPKTDKLAFISITACRSDRETSIIQQERDDALTLMSKIFEVSDVGIVVTDHHRRIVKINDSFERLYGWTRQELLGNEFSMVIAEADKERARKNHDSFIDKGVRSSGEMRIQHKDGSIASTLYTSATLELSHQRRFQVSIIIDITVRKQMEMSLRMAKERADAHNQAKSTFLANMSHELRTPLNAIIGFSELMMKETFGPLGTPRYKEYLSDVNVSAQHLLEIINEVLDMSKIEAGRLTLDEGPVQIENVLDGVARMMASRAFSNNVSIVLREPKEKLPGLWADAKLVRQILINLLTNALKFAEENGKVEIGAYMLESGQLRLFVYDDGIGIPKNRINEALEPFGQIHDSFYAKNATGTGLGLPLAKTMAELHGANFELESDRGKGTKIHVDFPTTRILNAHDDAPIETDLIADVANPADSV